MENNLKWLGAPISELFKKKFTFETQNYELPELKEVNQSPIWSIEELQRMKDHLNSVKSKLNDLKIEIWSAHTKSCRAVDSVSYEIRQGDTQGELVTQAWCKMYEILGTYDLISDSSSFRSMHLCEAPGGFIAALNHFLALKYPDLPWEWKATTLNPYYEGNAQGQMIIDDRFILQTMDHWDFGADYTGNILSSENLAKIKSWGQNSVDLVTADGSIDCQLTPDRQEEEVARLHVAEAVTALSILKSGGHLVLKMFTIFECSSVNLLFLLNCVFEEVDIYKPATSKEGNSEIYVICRGFKGHPRLSEYLEAIFESKSSPDRTMFSRESIPEGFLKQIERASEAFMSFQVAVIERNLATFEKIPNHEKFKMRKLKMRIAKYFVEKYDIRPIEESRKIMDRNMFFCHVNLSPGKPEGSFTERKMMSSQTSDEKLLEVQNKIYYWKLSEERPKAKPFELPTRDLVLKLQKCPLIGRLVSSKFLYPEKMKIFQDVCSLSRPQVSQPPELEQCQALRYLHFLESYSEYEKELINAMINRILSLEVGSPFVLRDIPLFTHALVSLVFYLGSQVFERFDFSPENEVVFAGKISNGGLVEVRDALNESRDETLASLVDLPLLYAPYFYLSVIKYNTVVALEYCTEYLRLLELPLDHNFSSKREEIISELRK